MALEKNFDAAKELHDFQCSKLGVKGLIDSGITKIPKFFVRPKENSPNPSILDPTLDLEVPTIDLSSINDNQGRKETIDKIYKASSSFGFFQLVNHGIPEYILGAVVEGVRAFHEGDPEIKSKMYTTDDSRKVRFLSNPVHNQLAYGSWRDTFVCDFNGLLDFNEIPVSCRKSIIDYKDHLLDLERSICELLSEALGLKKNVLASIYAGEGPWKQFMACNYYPPCPKPELTIGAAKHKDPSFITILLQDSVGGLQVYNQEKWINVSPVHGALIVNIGDFLQLVSNGKFKSVEHRVLANDKKVPRISVAMFLNPEAHTPCGPINQLRSETNPPIYQDILISDYMKEYVSKGATTTALENFKI